MAQVAWWVWIANTLTFKSVTNDYVLESKLDNFYLEESTTEADSLTCGQLLIKVIKLQFALGRIHLGGYVSYNKVNNNLFG